MNLPVVLSDSLAELIRLSSCCDSSAERDEWRPDAAWAAPAGPPGPDCGCDPPCGWPMAASMASSSSLLLSSPLVSWCAASSDFRCIPATSPEANESFKCRLNRRESELRFTCLIPRIFFVPHNTSDSTQRQPPFWPISFGKLKNTLKSYSIKYKCNFNGSFCRYYVLRELIHCIFI